MNKIVVTLLFTFMAWATIALVTSNVDSTEIKIGSAFNFTIKATATEGSKVVFPTDKALGTFEVLEQAPIDTVKKADQIELTQNYLLTQFDAGEYTLPRLSVYIDEKNHQTDLLPLNRTCNP